MAQVAGAISWSRVAHLAAAGFLLALGVLVFGPALQVWPLRGDNLYILAWVDQAPAGALLALDPIIYPEWRPLPFQMLWLEHRLVQLDWVALHFFINLLIWAACAWLVYRLVAELTASFTAALFSAVLVLVDQRAMAAMTWIVERQTTMACAFGLSALLVVARARHRALAGRELVLVSGLLLASALSKEYGLAYAGAILCYALFNRLRNLGAASVAALLAYGGLRIGLAGGALRPYCEEFILAGDRSLCLGTFANPGLELAQMAYNVVTTGVGIPLPGFFDFNGAIDIYQWEVAIRGVLLVPALVAVAGNLPQARLIALVPICNALLSLMVFRARNQLIGATALAVVMGIGLAYLQAQSRDREWGGFVRALAMASFLALLARDAQRTNIVIGDRSTELLEDEPCASYVRDLPYGPRFVTMVKSRFGLDDPHCLTSDE